jgi:hypothetical protein
MRLVTCNEIDTTIAVQTVNNNFTTGLDIFGRAQVANLVICNKEEKELQDLSVLMAENPYNRNRIISPSLFVCWD